MKSKLLVIGFCLFLLTSGVIFIYFKQNTCRQLSCIAMDHLAEFKIQDIYQEHSNSFRALYKYDKNILIAEVISQLDANEGRQYVQAELTRMKGLFSSASAPYPEVISDEIVCGNNYSYLPIFNTYKTTSGLGISYFTGYLNKQLVFGTCDPNDITYKGIVAYFYCQKNKQAFQLQIIAPKEDFDQSPSYYRGTMQSIRCK